MYNNIKITLNGNAVTPKDASGNTVEPFIIDGTTYLPVRAVGNALEMGVGWDGSTNTVKLTSSSSSDSKWSKYNDSYPFLFLHSATDDLMPIYGLIVNYRNLTFLTYGRVANNQITAANYATFQTRADQALKTMYANILSASDYIDTLEGAHDSAKYKALQQKAKAGYENLLFAVFSLKSMIQTVEDCRMGKSGTATVIDVGDSSVGDYLAVALSNIESAGNESMEYMINALPSN